MSLQVWMLRKSRSNKSTRTQCSTKQMNVITITEAFPSTRRDLSRSELTSACLAHGQKHGVCVRMFGIASLHGCRATPKKETECIGGGDCKSGRALTESELLCATTVSSAGQLPTLNGRRTGCPASCMQSPWLYLLFGRRWTRRRA